jgi:DNA-binding MarR family transcriptional regulator
MKGELPVEAYRRNFDATREARRRWEERGWPKSEAMEAAISIMRANRLVRSALDTALQELNIAYSQYEVLGLLSFSRDNRLAMNRLSQLLGLHPASMTNTVERLTARGCVRRVSDPADRRMVYAELTPEGWELLTTATEALVEINFGMKSLDVDELQTLSGVITELRHAYETFDPEDSQRSDRT